MDLVHLLANEFSYFDSLSPGIASRALMIHRDQQMKERTKLSKHRRKCLLLGRKYLGVVIDGMDQKKTAIPHWPSPPKNVDKDCLLKVHVVRALIFNHTVQSRAFMMFGNIKADANLTVTVLHRIISEWEGPLPPVLYVQLDNTTRENKNGVLVGYLNLLVEMGIFEKVKIGFLLVGHTHDQIDQMFSRYSVRLRRERCFTLPVLIETIQSSYRPKPEVTILKETWDFTDWFRQPSRLFETLHNATFNQQFRIRMVDKQTRMWAKQFSTDEFWLPPEGIKHLKSLPKASRNILSSEQHPLKAYSELKRSNVEGRAVDPETAVLDIQENMKVNCYKYFSSIDIQWWEDFFKEQLHFASFVKHGIRQPLRLQLSFPQPYSEETTLQAHVDDVQDLVVEVEELKDQVFGRRRDIYTGSTRPEPGTVAHSKKFHLGDLEELQVGSFLAVACEDDEEGRPFWIAKVLAIRTFMCSNSKHPKDIFIQWFATESSDPFTGRYFPSVEKIVGKGRGKKQLHKQVIDLGEVTVLAFGFDLTTRSILRATTIRVIKENLFSFERTKPLKDQEEDLEVDTDLSTSEESGDGEFEKTDTAESDSDAT